MRQRGSEAYALDGQTVAREQAAAPRLVALEGGRLDANARRGVSAPAVRLVSCLVALAITVFLAGTLSVALTSGTVSLLQSNSDISSQIKETTAVNDDLRIECSIMSRAERISRIATQNLGMVYANDATRLSLD